MTLPCSRGFWLSLALVALAPVTARADATLAASVGKSFRLTRSLRGEPSTVMVSPGLTFTDLLRGEVGFAVSLPDLAGGVVPAPVDIQLRPSLVIDPPLFPLYLRVFGVVSSILHGLHVIPGVAAGVDFGVGPASFFFEVGAQGRFLGTGTDLLLEPRAGVLFSF